MKKIWQKLKTRLGISSDLEAAIILLCFALSGFSTLFVHREIDLFLGISDKTLFIVELIVFLLLILPVYNLFLLFWGSIFGKKEFFMKFIKLKLRFIRGSKK
jgi:hypothetical protein